MDKKYVTTGLRRDAGGVYRAVAGTTLPTDSTTSLASAFKEQGFISEDGITKSHSRDTVELKDMNGVPIRVIKSSETATIQLKALEVLNIETIKTVYGDDNVTGTLTNGLTVKDKPAYQPVESVWAIDLISLEGDLTRLVIPRGMITDLGDEVYKYDEALAFDMTLTCLPDSSGVSIYEYDKVGTGGTTN